MLLVNGQTRAMEKKQDAQKHTQGREEMVHRRRGGGGKSTKNGLPASKPSRGRHNSGAGEGVGGYEILD